MTPLRYLIELGNKLGLIAADLADTADAMHHTAASEMHRKRRAYICHPVAGDTEANIDNALGWLKWLVQHTTWAVGMPWAPYVLALKDEDASHRARGLEDACCFVDGHDFLVLVGGRVSEGMAVEKSRAEARGMLVIDLTEFGFNSPEKGSQVESQVIGKLMEIVPHTIVAVVDEDYSGSVLEEGIDE
jgi:hypothetical protein